MGFDKLVKIALWAESNSARSSHQRKPQCQPEMQAWSLLPGPATPLAALGSLLDSVSSLKKKLQLFGPPQAPGFFLLHPFTLRVGQESRPTGNR